MTAKKPHIDSHLRKHMLELQLVPVVETDNVKSYYMRKPGTGLYRVLLTFTPEGICIQGDVTPECNGSVSCMGYGLDWFLNRNGGKSLDTYMCEKFLQRKWVPDLAADAMERPEYEFRRAATTPEQIEGLDQLCEEIRDGGVSAEGTYHSLEDLGFIDVADVPGFGYDPIEAGVLCAIQQRFAELWAERVQANAAGLPASVAKPDPESANYATTKSNGGQL